MWLHIKEAELYIEEAESVVGDISINVDEEEETRQENWTNQSSLQTCEINTPSYGQTGQVGVAPEEWDIN